MDEKGEMRDVVPPLGGFYNWTIHWCHDLMCSL